MKSIFVATGDKGGIGKSTVAEVMAEHAARRYGGVLVVEGDALITDVAPRAVHVDGASVVTVDLARQDASEDAITALFSVIEERSADIDHVVINTPASVSSTIDRQADLIRPICDEMGMTLIVGWMIDSGEDSARLSHSSQLATCADLRVAIINERHAPATRMP